uniref:Uncharacterized protein n=1 Tax=Varanus komodoensis TaxID=61221 RepID=A0A8D2L9N3_VARKO
MILNMDFLRCFTCSTDYWVGLQRSRRAPWRWTNSAIFNSWFQVHGIGECAHMSRKGTASSTPVTEQARICSMPANR